MAGAGRMPETKPIDRDRVRIVRTSLVQPARPTTRHSMFMPAVDRMLSKLPPSRTILFYKTDEDLTKAAEALRHGLAATLVAFYPMAGRLMPPDRGRFAIDCNDQGVELLEAHCDIPFAELECNNFPMQPLFRQLAPMDTYETSEMCGVPLASFQVTAFLGGLTVSIAISHAVADGHAMWMFVRAVTEACRGEPISVLPLHARILLKAEVFTVGASFPDMPLEKLTSSDGGPCSKIASYTVMQATNSALPLELFHERTVHFTQEMLENLKRSCFSCDDNSGSVEAEAPKLGSFVSTYQALAAYLWKRFTMAQGLHDETCTELRVSMDVRMRMIPPLTPAFFGNAIIVIPVTMTAKQLTAESLGATAARIQQSIQNADDEYIKKAMVACEGVDLRKASSGSMKKMQILTAVSFPVYEGGDFGWGEPEAARSPWGSREEMFTWYPSKKPKSIDVIACLTNTTFANFFSHHIYPNDPLWPSPFTCSEQVP